MTDEEKEAIVAGIIALAGVWAIFKFARRSSSGQRTFQDISAIVPDYGVGNVPLGPALPIVGYEAGVNLSPVSNTPPSQTPPCDCAPCNSCPASPYVIKTVNDMLANGAAVSNYINQLGNSTLEALAKIANQENSLLKVTVG